MLGRLVVSVGLFFGAAHAVQAAALDGSTFNSGNWEGSAYLNDDTGRFSHCAMSTSYNSGVTIHFAIDSDYKWRFGLSHKDWVMTQGDSVPITYQIDRHARGYATAKVLMADFMLAELSATNEVFNQFRRGNMLRVTAGNQDFSFRLQGTQRALSTMLDCVNRHLHYVGVVTRAPAPAPAPQPKSNAALNPPAETGTGDNSIFANSPQDVLAATRFVVRLFAASDFASYRIVDEPAADASEFVKTAAVGWHSPDANGTLHVLKSESATPDSVIADVISDDSKYCDGNFASGKRVVEENNTVKSAFTACKIGNDYKYYVDYVVFKNASGRIYLISSVQSQKSEVNQAVSESLARNVGLTVAQ